MHIACSLCIDLLLLLFGSPVRPHMLVTAKPPALRERNLQQAK
jgi:hypothetical protein